MIQNMQSLKDQLQSVGIDISVWGQGEAKTLISLQKEIESGEVTLVINETGTLVREVIGAGADVYYTTKDGKKFRLKEEKQVFLDGRERHRTKRMGNAVSEKMKPGEDPIMVLVRGVREELGLEDISFEFKGTYENIAESQSYPGLLSKYVLHLFEVHLKDSQFKIEGYVEEQDNLKTYFVWEEECNP